MSALRRKDAGPRPAKSASSPRVLEYLQQCLDQKRPMAIITGVPGSGKSMLLRRFLHYTTEGPVAYAKKLGESPHAFLESILLQFGFETFDSSLSELRNLTMVFVRYQASKGCRPVVVVEDAHKHGAPVLNLIQMLSKLEVNGESALLFILTGNSDLQGLLKASVPAAGCDLDELNAMPVMPNQFIGQTVGHLEIQLGDKLISQRKINRQQILIGRKQKNDITLEGRYISRHHAVLINKPMGVHIVDLKSKNGLRVNGETVRKHALANGDVISIGDYQLKFTESRDDQSDTPTTHAIDDTSQTVAMRREPSAPV
jgi:hypothetical protein